MQRRAGAGSGWLVAALLAALALASCTGAGMGANADAGADASALADATAGADIGPPAPVCVEVPAPPAVSGEPITYAQAAPSTIGKVTCGAAAAPYFWATADMPAPIPCTDTCAPAAHADTTVCAGGQCLVARCAPGWQDRNGWGNDGCEAEVPVACDLYVEATALGAAGQDGSAAHPFAGIRSAFCVAKAGCVVHVGPGTYAGDVVLDKPGLVLRGAGPEKTVLIGDEESTTKPQAGGAPTILITVDDVVVEGLAIVNGYRSGISASASVARPLLRQVAVKNVEVFSPNLYKGTEQVSGIRIDAKDARVIASAVVNTGGVDGIAWVSAATGVSVGESGRVLGVRVSLVQGLETQCVTYESGCQTMFYGPQSGGNAVGIAGGPASLASGCEVGDLHPGKGSGDPANGKYSQPVSKSWSNGAQIPFQGIGTDPTDSLDGQPWLDLVACDGGAVHDVSLGGMWHQIHVSGGHDVAVHDNTIVMASRSPLAAIAMDGCENCQISNNQLSNLGLTGIAVKASPKVVVQGNQMQHVAVPDGFSNSSVVGQSGTAMAIHVEASAACAVAANSIADVNARWSDSGESYINEEYGGEGIGIYLADAPGCALTGNKIAGVKSGPRDATTDVGHGWAAGIVAAGAGPVAIVGNSVADVVGSPAWAGTYPPGGGPWIGAEAFGIRCGPATCAPVAGNAINSVVPGLDAKSTPSWDTPPPNVAKSYCLDLSEPVTASVDHLTCSGATFGLRNVDKGTVEVRNSIIAYVEAAFGAYGKFTVAWTDIWPASAMPTGGVPGSGILNVDPLFVDATMNVHLKANSPAIDAGDPAAPYCGEPAPNGCRVDLGAYGGTAHATPKAGAEQCACP